MKHIPKFSLLAVTAAILSTGAALADDPQLQNRLAMQRAEAQRNQKTTTIAVYANGRGLDREATTARSEQSELKLMRRDSARGQDTFYYVPAQ